MEYPDYADLIHEIIASNECSADSVLRCLDDSDPNGSVPEPSTILAWECGQLETRLHAG